MCTPGFFILLSGIYYTSCSLPAKLVDTVKLVHRADSHDGTLVNGVYSHLVTIPIDRVFIYVKISMYGTIVVVLQ